MKKNKDYLLKYNLPAEKSYKGWESQALPLGNGEIGNMIYGLIGEEIIQFNEKSLWSGGPRPDETDYNGGNYKNRYPFLFEIRKKLSEGNYEDAKDLAEEKLIGPNSEKFGKYLSFGELKIDFINQFKIIEETEKFLRVLNISEAIHKTSYIQKSIEYIRESFVSYVDDVSVTKIESLYNGEKIKKLDFDLDFEITNRILINENYEKSDYKIYTKIVNRDSIYLSGYVKDNELKFGTLVKIKTDGKINIINEKLRITDASTAVLVFTAKTDYALNPSTNYRKKNFDIEKEVFEIVGKAFEYSYEALKNRHIEDYKKLFNRVKLEIPEGSYLQELLFQYGRYLLISSSRPGENHLPANLQGVWNSIDNPAWNSDYHLNVNLQMNYWPAYITNLVETVEPLNQYIDSLRYYGRIAAKEYANIVSEQGEENGWLVHTQNNIFGWTAPGWDFYWGWAHTSNAWIMQNIYDGYNFTLDKIYLKEKIYPILKETVKFWNSYLIYDENSDRYVATPSYSPEHGGISIGNTYDQSLVYQLFKDFIEAYEIVEDSDYIIEEVKDKFIKLKPLSITKDGKIKEWYEEDEISFDKSKIEKEHRHASHLVGLYPGEIFTEDEHFEAAKNSLNDRGDFGTGWSKANKINLWSRLYDGNRAFILIQNMIKESILENLFDTHPPFQIDGNFGLTSAIAEMLIQSHNNKIILLPALPDKWHTGEFRGLRARGGFIASCKWENNKVNYVKIESTKDSKLNLLLEDIESFVINLNSKLIENNFEDIKISLKKYDILEFYKK